MPQILTATNDRMSIRINAEDKQLLMKAVALTHTNITEFVLQQILPKARQIVQEHEERHFSQRDLALIMDLLDNPPPPTERLHKAVKALKESYNGL